ncbi:LEAF RUST 10 DISEASE-RESISTANCE LOCUS RECEPTOR-LIKE PROTEIN KINASE-like 1.2 [Cryptomeria japonica]|uniref:LEAF RUST 10 DISEASE-RESISTANCE LOCUS RECEPTOR-LIKE PROTEIN KINASE-like 1.2 n=1 Tax=Cryptomeria japonica TaxID=3369 RepID=UPI0027DA1C95|nr:LEAF RUST 10 DISEASE-RESISTANCE LOCUS RECEPTOR-LIKE PROTEIN KINASE-like 1.2 [Cryptomeria japonica]
MEALLPLHLCHSLYTSPRPLYPLRFLFLIFTISISFLASSSRPCPEFKCGYYVFPYPFGQKNSGCGDPTLQLECDTGEGMALINIGGYQYYILRLSKKWEEDHIMTIIDKSIRWKRCNPSLFGSHTTQISLITRFHNNNGYKNLTVWGQCAKTIRRRSLVSPLSCNASWYFILKDESSFESVCKSQVTVQVVNQVSGIQDGFQVTWEPNKACKDCESRGRFCAYDKTSSTQIYCKRPKGKSQTLKIILGSIGGTGLAAAVVALFIYYIRRRKASPTRWIASDFSDYQGTDIEEGQKGYMLGALRIFPYQELQQATNFFDEQNELGDGGFGAVYLGKLVDGRAVAVKRLYQENSRRIEQFINEVQILSSLDHPNLVRLYGCTSLKSPILILVYEYVPNGTLADHLHGSRRSLRGLPWGIRLKIALQTAQALAYLHSIEPPIFHRDVKSNNILLDEYFGAKVADFGLSRLVPVNVSHVTTAPQGTPGYVDPEYHECFQLTEKSDVYSFGVVLVEIISAKVAVDMNRNRNEISLATMAIEKIRRGVLDELVDPDLKIESNHEVKAMVAAVAELAFECLARERDFRPSMNDVVARLEQINEMLQQSIESSKFTSISITASALSVPITGKDRSGQYWVPLSL